MLELYQFEASHYCEKIRLILDYKQLPYRKIEVSPGVGQLDLFRLSGQRQVPVLKDGDEVVADSTAIAFFLEKKYPERPILPADPKHKGLCLMMEEWADESIGLNARKAMIGAFNQHPNFRTALLPSSTPDVLRNLLGSVPGDVLNLLGTGVGFGPEAVKTATDALKQNLEALCLLLQTGPYLVSDYPTLADFAVAGLTMYIKFPASRYVDLPADVGDKGIPGLADDPAFQSFFDWRDRLYADYRKIRETPPPSSSNSSGSGPTPISID
ncbi:MAG TPA: glutathione S-transferase family protein [Leptolyngbyaceae cyanobacterium]